MIQLEESIGSSEHGFNSVNQLVEQYTVRPQLHILTLTLIKKAVEYYDSIKDPVTHYFMEKISATLSKKSTVMLLLKQGKKTKLDTIEEEH